MADGTTLGKAYIQILPSMDGTKDKILGFLNKDAGNAGTESGKTAGSSLLGSLKDTIAKLGITKKIGKTISDSLMAGADMEQQIGGIETMFKESAGQMRAYADQAYKTCGISANQYMSQATSFSASLLQSLGGDTAKAADYANRAMMDMGDNANKFGSDMGSIQNAYQGFAKANYTMLDNLKLGYGGTKEEMQRLIADASKMTDVQSKLNVSVQNGDLSFGNIVNAISVMQDSLGVTGTTSKEAASTFSGSFAAMKASAENLMASLMMNGKDGVDVTATLEPLIASVNTFVFDNLFPAIGRMASAIPPLIGTFLKVGLPSLLEHVGQFASSVMQFCITKLPEYITLAMDAIGNLAIGIVQGLPNAITAVVKVANGLIATFLQRMPEFCVKGSEIILNLIDGIVANIPRCVSALLGGITRLITLIGQNLPQFLAKGGEIIGNLLSGLVQRIPDLIGQIPQICRQLWNAFMAVDWIGLGANILGGIGAGIANAVSGLVDGAIKACGKLVDSVKSFFGIHSPSRLMRDEIGAYLPAGIGAGIDANMDTVLSPVKEMNRAIEDAVAPEISKSIAVTASDVIRAGREYSGTSNMATAYYGDITINVNAKDGQSARAIAKEVKKILVNDEEIERRGKLA